MEKLIIKALGLSRHSNIAERPDGSLSVAENIVMDRPGIYSPRRGFARCLGTFAANITHLIPYKDEIFPYSNNKLYRWDETTGTLTAKQLSGVDYSFGSTYLRSAQANANLYLTSATGVMKLDTTASSLVESGVAEALSGFGSTTGASGWLVTDSVVAYRVLFGIRDANSNLILGAPSNPIIVTNSSGGDRDVSLTFDLPGEITTTHFYRVYRTIRTAGVSSNPGDEMTLIAEGNPTNTDVSNKYVTITDQIADSLISGGVALYTNASSEGITQANDQPPKLSDLAPFNGYLFGCCPVYRHSIEVQLLATGGTAGLQVNDTITVGGQTYTAKAAENTASKQFLCESASGSPATDIRITAESLVKCINRNSSNTTIYAYYDSSTTDLPGKIRVEERNFGGSAFTFACSRTTCFNPSGTQTSTAESRTNRLVFSKASEPEAFPYVNYIDVGNSGDSIVRIMALRESLFVFTESAIYRLTGFSPSDFSVELFDSSTKLIATNTLAVFNNQIVGLFDQGVCRISQSGVQVISLDIEDDIKSWLASSNATQLYAAAHATAYESDRKYLLWVPTVSTLDYPDTCYVFNSMSEAWTTWDRSAWSAVVNPYNDLLYIAPNDSGWVCQERKNQSISDFADENISVTVNTVLAKVLTLSSVADLTVGDIYVETSTRYSLIAAIDTDLKTITLADDITWTTGSRTVQKRYDATLEYNPCSIQSVSHMKQFTEALLVCDQEFTSASVSFRSELSLNWEAVEFTGSEQGSWGLFSWGSVPWGGLSGFTLFNHRMLIPRKKQRCGALFVKVEIPTIYNSWAIAGLELTYRDAGGRLTR